jgi:Membrane protein involved in the export of O-antigen and teichoic acid
MSTYIFGLIVFPYISRVLGVNMIGRINFADQTVYYFRIIAAMGISTVGIREIAACGNDRERRSQVFSDIFSFILVMAIVAVVALVVLTFTIPKWTAIKDLLIVGSFYIFFSSMMVEWFYQGMENFKYVTIRSIVVKVIYILLVFLLVKSPDDYLIYYVLLTGTIVVNAIINLGYSRKYVTLNLFNAHPWKYAKSILALGLYMLMLSFFTTFNVIYLGMVKGDHDVGVYTTATKIYGMVLGILTAYTSVMLPRMSSLLSENKVDEFRMKVDNSFKIVFSLAPPLIAGGVILAPQIVAILAGPQYVESVLPMQMIMPLILVVGLAQIWVIQVLLPMKKDKVVLLSAAASAVVGVALNFMLVGKMSYIGSAIALLGAEVVNDTITFIYVIRKKLLVFPLKAMIRSLLLAVPYVAVCLMCLIWIHNQFLALAAAMIVCLAYFMFLNGRKKLAYQE